MPPTPEFKPDRFEPASAPKVEATPLELTDPFDFKKRRQTLLGGVKDAFDKSFKTSNDRHELTVHNLEYENKDYSLKDEKEALESGRTLDVPLKGTIRLTDKATGDVLDEKRTTLARVPYMTNRGTFVHQGSSYSASSQIRLKPGAYVRSTAAGTVEMHINTLPGTGRGFRLAMEPRTGLFSVETGNAKLPALPILRALGCPDDKIRSAIGDELFDKNEKKGARFDVAKAVEKLAADKDVKDGGGNNDILKRAFARMKLDPEVVKRSLGVAHDTVTPDVLLSGMDKIIKVHKGEAEADDRDSLENSSFHTAESHFGERVEKDAGGLKRKLLWGATNKGNLSGIGPGAFTPYLKSVLVGSGLAAPMAEVNPLEVADGALKVTRLGEGGMSGDAVSVDTRSVHPSQFGFVDPIRTPESNAAGVDMRLNNGVKFGSDGNIYQGFRNLKTGKTDWFNPVQARQQKILFPHESSRNSPSVYGMADGREAVIPLKDATHELQHAHNMYSMLTSMIPGGSGAKGGRLSMGSRFWTQALALEGGEAPLVQTSHPDGGTVEERMGRHAGAVFSPVEGKVVKVDDDEIHVQDAKGKTHVAERYNNLSANQKSVTHTTPLVKVGDVVRADQPLAKSNFTDDRGVIALGKNLRVGYLPVSGTFEDGLVISQSAADKLTSHHMYQPSVDTRGTDVVVDKKKFTSIWPGKFTKAQLDKIGDDGRAKPGAVLHPGDPSILAVSAREPRAGQALINGSKGWFSDASVTWEKDHPGEVTSSRESKGYHQVNIKTTAGAELADKVSSLFGMKGVISKIIPDSQMIRGADGTPLDMLLNSNGLISRVNPSILATAALGKVAAHTGKPMSIPMFHQGNLAQFALDKLKEHGLEEHETVFDPQENRHIPGVFTGSIYALKLHHTAVAKGDVRSTGGYSLDDTPARSGEGGCFPASQCIDTLYGPVAIGTIVEKRLSIPVRTFSEKLGEWVYRPVTDWFTFESDADNVLAIETVGCSATTNMQKGKLRFARFSRQVAYPTKNHMMQRFDGRMAPAGELKVGDILTGIGPVVTSEQRGLLLGTILGDASVSRSLSIQYEHSAKQRAYAQWKNSWLAGLCPLETTTTHLDVSIGCGSKFNTRAMQTTINIPYLEKELRELCYDVGGGKRVSTKWLDGVNDLGLAAWFLDDGHFLETSKDPKKSKIRGGVATHGFSRADVELLAVWLSGKLSAPVRVDDAGITLSGGGRAYRLALEKEACSAILRIIAENVPWEAIPGSKVKLVRLVREIQRTTPARKPDGVCVTGKFPVIVQGISAAKGLTSRKVYDITVDETHTYLAGPFLVSNSKRVGGLDVNALLGYGATGVLEDAKLVRGQKNDQFWRDFKLGLPVRMPTKSVTYEKFENMLRGAGVNVQRTHDGTRVMAMTDKDVDELAKGRKLESGDALDFKGETPVKGGLFDIGLTGGHGGTTWSALHLHEPMPSPIVEEPLRRILGLTKKQFDERIAQPDGGSKLKSELNKVDVPAKIKELTAQVRDGSPSERNDAVKVLNYLKAFKEQGTPLGDLVVSRVPVLPPKFRPVTFQRGVELTSDANLLYKDLFEANRQLETMKGKTEDVGPERVAVYHAMKALSGLGDPLTKERKDKGVAGLLSHVFGKNTSKYGLWQRGVVSTPVDMVGRAVVTPDDRLDIDQVGIPEDKAWELYKPFIMRRLSQKYQTGGKNGISAVDLAKWVHDKDPRAKQEMLAEMRARPVIINRAPVWHKFGFLGAMPVLTAGRQLRVPPLLCAGMGMDFDGDTAQFHVPITDRAVHDTLTKMMPSKNLYAENSFGPQLKPTQEYLLGLNMATAPAGVEAPKVFKSMEEAKRAYRRGEIRISTPIEIRP